MANVYWHAGTGNWSDHATHWFNATDGGGGGHGAPPGTDDNAIFDSNSFDEAGRVVTVDATANCLDMTWTGATNTPTLTTSNNLNIYGNITFIAAMVLDGALAIICAKTGTQTITTNTLSIGNVYLQTGIGTTVSFQDAFDGNAIRHTYGTLLTNNNDITLSGDFRVSEANATVLTMGSSTITCARWRYTGSNFTLTANTGTIKVTGTGAFEGGGITTYNNVELNGSAHTVSGSNTFANLKIATATTCTVTFTDGTTQTITTPVLSGDGTHQHTLTGTSTAGWILTTSSTAVSVSYCTIDYSQVAGSASWYAYINNGNVNGGNNLGWKFNQLMGGANSVLKYVPPHLKSYFRDKNNRHNGLDPYGWSTEGLVLYLPLWALKSSAFKSVDAYKHTCAVSEALWQPDGRLFIEGDDSIDCGFTGGIQPTTGITLEVWLKITATSASHQFIVHTGYDFGANKGILLLVFQEAINIVYCNVGDGAAFVTVNANAAITTNWEHYCLTWDGTTVRIYRNGAVQTVTAAMSNPISYAANNFLIGNTSNSVGAVVGELREYNRGLSAEEVANNYNSTITRYQ